MSKSIKIIFISLLFLSCNSELQDTFRSKELVSSQGEKIYINSLNWGVTDDYQISIISSNENRCKERTDTIGVVKGLEPFFYSFKNDSLKLFFNHKISYKLTENFKTINVSYILLSNQDFNLTRTKSFKNEGVHSVPIRE